MHIFPRSSPESAPSVIPTEAAFHEAILASSSSVRDSLPKEHHKHFETLRQEIIDFASSHDIPRESLAKPDDLREAASKLSTPDLKRLANLLERFEYLLKNKEPRKEDYIEALEHAERLYHLEEQYTSQVKLLEQVGILKDGVITGIDGKQYLIPTLEQIASRLFERREELSTKHDQGFTKLLLVPFGMSLDNLREVLRQFLLDYKENNPSFDLDTDRPLRIWEEGYQGADIGDSPKLVYHPQSFIQDGHGGKTKMEIVKTNYQLPTLTSTQSPFPGWTIHLFQPSNLESQDTETPIGFALIPQQGQGTPQGDLTPRPSLEEGKTPNEYLSILKKAQNDPNHPYSQESGMTPEDWIMAFMTHLSETGKPIDNHANGIENILCLTGVFFRFSVNVPFALWNRDRRQAGLGWGDPRSRDRGVGARFSVII